MPPVLKSIFIFRTLTPNSSSSTDIQHLEGRTGNGNRMQGGPKPLDEPDLLTSSQDIEVVLGDTTVLPCKVANLGTLPP